jgi:hypothetical protein
LIVFASGETAANSDVVSSVYPEDGTGRSGPGFWKGLFVARDAAGTRTMRVGGWEEILCGGAECSLVVPPCAPNTGSQMGGAYGGHEHGLNPSFRGDMFFFSFSIRFRPSLARQSNALNRSPFGR